MKIEDYTLLYKEKKSNRKYEFDAKLNGRNGFKTASHVLPALGLTVKVDEFSISIFQSECCWQEGCKSGIHTRQDSKFLVLYGYLLVKYFS